MGFDDPLVQCPNVIVIPRISYKSDDSIYERSRVVTENIIKFIQRKPQNIVPRMKWVVNQKLNINFQIHTPLGVIGFSPVQGLWADALGI